MIKPLGTLLSLPDHPFSYCSNQAVGGGHRRQYCFGHAPGRETQNSRKAISSSPAWDSHSETWLRLLRATPATNLLPPAATLNSGGSPVVVRCGHGQQALGKHLKRGDMGHSLPPEIFPSGRKDSQGKHFGIHIETAFYKVLAFFFFF